MYPVSGDRICEVSSSVGTGDMVLAGAVSGNRPFSSVCALPNGNRVRYVIYAVDASGVPNGLFEAGLGRFAMDGSTPLLKRDVKISGSTAGSALETFDSGMKRISITALADMVGVMPLRGYNPTYYVRADGNDANSGLENTAGGAFLTLSEAMIFAQRQSMDATIYVGPGSFNGFSVAPDYRGGYIDIIGSGSGLTTIQGCSVGKGGWIGLSGLKLQHSNDWSLLRIDGEGSYAYLEGVAFGSINSGSIVDGHHIECTNGGLAETGGHTIAGNANSHLYCNSGGKIIIGGSIGLDANRSVTAFAKSARYGVIDFLTLDIVLGGHSITGKRFDVDRMAMIDTHGAGLTALPGSVNGTETNGGRYI